MARRIADKPSLSLFHPQKYAFSKPLPSQNIIFFCRSGKRSATAAEWAGDQGYPNIRNYSGSWLEWSKREKEEDDN
jgi:3-mercaptopyruvate sulfurtransferase SseA